MDKIPQPDPEQWDNLRRQVEEERVAESIRAQVLTMHSRDDLLKVIGAVYQALIELGMDAPVCSIMFVDANQTLLKRYVAFKSPSTYGISWNAENLQAFSNEIVVGHAEEAVTAERDQNMSHWRQGKTWSVVHPQEAVLETMLFMQERFGLDRPLPLADRPWQSTYVPFQHGWISIWQPVGADYTSLIKRMTQTLSLGYLRFLDLQHLEHQNQALKETLNQLHQTQSQLVLQEKMAALGRLVAGITHEINTPLGAVVSMYNTQVRAIEKVRQGLLHSDQAADPGLQKAFALVDQARQVIVTGTDRIANIVRNMQSFVQLDRAHFQQADVHQGLDSILTLWENQLDGRIIFRRDYAERKAVYCAPSRLNQAFMALLENAVQAIDGPGQIEVKTTCKDGHIHIQITDSGRGIPAERVNTLFDFDFSKTGTRVKMGFGLLTAHNIIRDHNGQLSVESQPGHGTIVIVRLPLDQGRS